MGGLLDGGVAGGVGIAFTLTLLAGLATGLGGLTAFMADRANARFLAISLGFSAGVMLYVSFVEILPKAHEFLAAEGGERAGAWAMVGGFFGGIAVIAVIDRLVPAHSNPHEFTHEPQDIPRGPLGPARPLQPSEPVRSARDSALLRMGLLTAVAIAIHNFPEGFATFMTALADPELAIPVTVAIALHNVPEGIAVAVPVYQATGSKMKALGLAFVSGLAEPVGAVLGFAVLRPWLTDTLFGVVFAAVAGIMVFISLDKLLPTSEKYGGHHLSVYGLVAGMAVMAVSLVMLI
ncbi:zinc transporter ZupT [Kocuria coralli]|uniref:zinc transporter ZupT n=1 Tax=Kocuria coralli TaxID=1461025 RepID=UPI001FECADC9|nr:zinc transporter ZupT [Kocuria coralli]